MISRKPDSLFFYPKGIPYRRTFQIPKDLRNRLKIISYDDRGVNYRPSQIYGNLGDIEESVFKNLNMDTFKRIKYKAVKFNPYFDDLDPIRSAMMSYYFTKVPIQVFDEFKQIMSDNRISFASLDTDSKWLILEHIGDESKTYQDVYSEYWIYFVDMITLKDYKKYENTAESSHLMRESVKLWLNNSRKRYAIGGGSEEWLSSFRQNAKKIFARRIFDCKFAQSERLKLDDYCLRPDLFSTSGAMHEIRLNDKYGKTVRGTKWNNFLSMTADGIKGLCMSEKPQFVTSINKRETKKVRGVVSGDPSVFMKQSFLSQIVEDQFLKRWSVSPLFMDKQQTIRFWDWYSKSIDGKTFHMPLDQSKFDHNVSLDEISIILDEMYNVLVDFMTDEEKYIFKLLSDQMIGGVVLIDRKYKLPITSGIMSGWRWTALLNTIINMVQFYTINEMIGIDDPDSEYIYKYWYGDDIVMGATNRYLLEELLYAYKEVGYDVNLAKNFISKDTNEFLRKVATERGVVGYPARSVKGLVISNPVSQGSLPNEDTTSEVLVNFNDLNRRILYAARSEIIQYKSAWVNEMYGEAYNRNKRFWDALYPNKRVFVHAAREGILPTSLTLSHLSKEGIRVIETNIVRTDEQNYFDVDELPYINYLENKSVKVDKKQVRNLLMNLGPTRTDTIYTKASRIRDYTYRSVRSFSDKITLLLHNIRDKDYNTNLQLSSTLGIDVPPFVDKSIDGLFGWLGLTDPIRKMKTRMWTKNLTKNAMIQLIQKGLKTHSNIVSVGSSLDSTLGETLIKDYMVNTVRRAQHVSRGFLDRLTASSSYMKSKFRYLDKVFVD